MQQDNDLKPTSKSQWLKKKGISFFVWPSQSSYLSATEMLWRPGWETSAANLYLGRATPASPFPYTPGPRTDTWGPASSQPSSHGTVNWTRIIFWSLRDHSTMSGRSVVSTTSGNFSRLPTSTAISQELAGCNRLVFLFLSIKGFTPSLMKGIWLLMVVLAGLLN